MSAPGSFDRTKHFSELNDPLHTTRGLISSVERKNIARANLGLTTTVPSADVAALLSAPDNATIRGLLNVPSLVSFSAFRHVNPEEVGDWQPQNPDFDHLATLQAAQELAQANNLWIHGSDVTVGVSGDWVPSTGQSVKLAELNIRQLNPEGSVARRSVNVQDREKFWVYHGSVDRNGNGTGGQISGSPSAGYFVARVNDVWMERPEVFGDDKGNLFDIDDCPSMYLHTPIARDARYVHTSETDDVINGIHIIRCADFRILNPIVRRLGRTDQTSANRDRFSRGIAIADSWGTVQGGLIERVDQGIDLSGSGNNREIIISENTLRDLGSFGIKLSNTATGVVVVGNRVARAGWYGIVVSLEDFVNYTSHAVIAENVITDTGTNQIWNGHAPAGVAILVGPGTQTQYAPNGITVRGNRVTSPRGSSEVAQSSTFTMFDGSTLALVAMLSPVATGQRVRLTTSGGLPTGLATGTDYWLIWLDVETVGSGGQVRLATSPINAMDGVAITGISGGTGTHTLTLQSDMDYGVINSTPFQVGYAPNTEAGNAITGARVQDRFGFHSPYAVGLVSAISMASGSLVDLALSSVTTAGYGQIAGASAEFSVPYDGKWRFKADGLYTANATGYRQISLSTNLQGAGYVGDGLALDRRLADTTGSVGTYIHLTQIYDLKRGDKVKFIGFQNSGSTLTLTATLSMEPVNA